VLCRTRVSVLARATLGRTYTHLGTHPSAPEDAQLVPSCSPAVRFSGSSNITQGVSPQVRARCDRAQLQGREETRPVIPGTRRRISRRGARPVDHPLSVKAYPTAGAIAELALSYQDSMGVRFLNSRLVACNQSYRSPLTETSAATPEHFLG
jgi:hypothetical protein